MNDQLTKFTNETALLPNLVAETCIAHREHNLTPEQQEWFIDHTESRAANLYQFNRDFAKGCKRNNNKGRDFFYMFVNHWLDAFIKNPTLYKNKHS